MTQGPETVRIGVSKFGDLHIHSRGEPLDGFPDQPEYIRADIHAAEVARLTATPKRDNLADMQATLDYAQARHLRILKELADAEAEVARLREALAGMQDCRKWWHYPIEMPITSDGQGPATVGVDAASITYEVWDQLLSSHASFGNLPDAINEAMRLNALAVKT